MSTWFDLLLKWCSHLLNHCWGPLLFAKPTTRSWIHGLQHYMPKWKREELKEKNDVSGFQMVRKYEDRTGATRVLGA